jgi:general secretion pathway protein H
VKTPTSATNPSRVQTPQGSAAAQPARGFTLVELLVVLAIAALMLAIVPSSFERLREGSQYRDTVRSLITDLKQARQTALAQGKSVIFHVHLADRNFGIAGQSTTALPSSLEIKTTVAQSMDSATASGSLQKTAQIDFLADGGSTGGTIELVRASGSGVKIQVDWLTGKVTQIPF